MRKKGYRKSTPKVNQYYQFLEATKDTGDLLEITREAVANAFDHEATYLKIEIRVEERNGYETLIIIFEDDGEGMSKQILENDFWGLGFSQKRDDPTTIGNKGRGAKTYLRSEKVTVITCDGKNTYESHTIKPYADLNNNKMFTFFTKELDDPQKEKGTKIIIEGYNNNQFASFHADVVKDYLYWYTKLGSVEGEFKGNKKPDFKVLLKCPNIETLDEETDENGYKVLTFGHKFAPENKNIGQIQKDFPDDNPFDYYVKKYIYEGSLPGFPHLQYQMVVYIEGDRAKKAYNKLLRGKKDKKKGHYKVSDRYGIYICKDYIPIERVNDWISGFLNGSNSFVLLHGFINFQGCDLTANRRHIARSNDQIMSDLNTVVTDKLEEIELDLRKNKFKDPTSPYAQQKKLKLENAEFKRRQQDVLERKATILNNRVVLAPSNEIELSQWVDRIKTLYPDLISCNPLDYCAHIGIDCLALNEEYVLSDVQIGYLEYKFELNKPLNHSFKNLRYLYLWDIPSKMKKTGLKFESNVDLEERILEKMTDEDGVVHWYLTSPKKSTRIQVIFFKDFLQEKLGIVFERTLQELLNESKKAIS